MLIQQNTNRNLLQEQGRFQRPQGECGGFAQQMSAETLLDSPNTQSYFTDENGAQVVHDGGYTVTISGEGGGSFQRSESYSSSNPVYNVTSFFKGLAEPCLGMDYSWAGQINVKNIDLNCASAIEMETLRQHLQLNIHITSETDQRAEGNYVELLEAEVSRLEDEGDWKRAQECQAALNQMMAYTGTVYESGSDSAVVMVRGAEYSGNVPINSMNETETASSWAPMGEKQEDSELTAMKNQLSAMIENSYDRARLGTKDEEEEEQEEFQSLLEMVDKAIQELPEETLAEDLMETLAGDGK